MFDCLVSYGKVSDWSKNVWFQFIRALMVNQVELCIDRVISLSWQSKQDKTLDLICHWVTDSSIS